MAQTSSSNDRRFNESEALKSLVQKGMIAQEEIETYLKIVPTVFGLRVAFHKMASQLAKRVKNEAATYFAEVNKTTATGGSISYTADVIRYLSLSSSRLYDSARELRNHRSNGRPQYLGNQTSTLEQALEMWIRLERGEKIGPLSTPRHQMHTYPTDLIFEWQTLFGRLPNRPSKPPAAASDLAPKAA